MKHIERASRRGWALKVIEDAPRNVPPQKVMCQTKIFLETIALVFQHQWREWPRRYQLSSSLWGLMKHSPAPKLRQPRQHLNQPTVWPIDADASRLPGLGRRQWRLQPSVSDWRTALDPPRPQAPILSNPHVTSRLLHGETIPENRKASSLGLRLFGHLSACGHSQTEPIGGVCSPFAHPSLNLSHFQSSQFWHLACFFPECGGTHALLEISCPSHPEC